MMAQLTLAQWRRKFSDVVGLIPFSLINAFLRDAGRDGALDAAEQALLAEFADRLDPEAAALRRNVVGTDQGGPEDPHPLTRLPVFAEIAAGRAVLRQGDQGPGVRALQEVLIRLDLGHWTPTQFFGELTAAALKEFQASWNSRHPVAPLPEDGVLAKDTLAALEAELLRQGGSLPNSGAEDQADVIIDLKRQRAYVHAALVSQEDLAGLIAELEAEGLRLPGVYQRIVAKVAPGGGLIDDFEEYPVVSERQLGLKDSDQVTRLYVSFPVGSGQAKGSGYLTPTGTFVIGERRKNREASQWGVSAGFNRNSRNPFGPRFLRLHRLGGSPTAYGLHGTTAAATWMNDPDGKRAVSHGCVRWANDVIVRLDKYLPPGAVVKIINGLEDEGTRAEFVLRSLHEDGEGGSVA